MKQYIINEEELLELLESKKQLEYLESAGVDNWSHYRECREEDTTKELIKFYEEYKDYTDDLK
jgi:hypothetical protein